MEIDGLTCSPDGRLVAFWGPERKPKTTHRLSHVFVLDWSSHQLSQVASLPDTGKKLGLACLNDGVVYAWKAEWVHGNPVLAPVTCYHTNGAMSQVGDYEQMVTNQAGAFGIRQRRGRCIEVEITNLDHPTKIKGHFYVPLDYGGVGDFVISDDGAWWGAQVFDVDMFTTSEALVVWSSQGQQALHLWENNGERGYRPVGLIPPSLN